MMSLQLTVLSLLKGLGGSILHVKDIQSYFSLLLERRSKYCSELDTSSQKLSKAEIKILSLLLEVNIFPSPIFLTRSDKHTVQFCMFN